MGQHDAWCDQLNFLCDPRTAPWADECHFPKIGLKIVAVGLNLSPFYRRYENVIHSFVAINTKEIIEH